MLNLIKYFNIYVTKHFVTNLVLPWAIFFVVLLVCSRDLGFLHDMNIQQIILPADDWQHAVVKNTHKK